MLRIRNRINFNGEIIDPNTYKPQQVVALEEFLEEIYADEAEKNDVEKKEV